jgi:hypothetical protein
LERGRERETDKYANPRSADNHCFEYSAPKKGGPTPRIRKRSYPERTPLVFNPMMFNSGGDPATVAGWGRASLFATHHPHAAEAKSNAV